MKPCMPDEDPGADPETTFGAASPAGSPEPPDAEAEPGAEGTPPPVAELKSLDRPSVAARAGAAEPPLMRSPMLMPAPPPALAEPDDAYVVGTEPYPFEFVLPRATPRPFEPWLSMRLPTVRFSLAATPTPEAFPDALGVPAAVPAVDCAATWPARVVEVKPPVVELRELPKPEVRPACVS